MSKNVTVITLPHASGACIMGVVDIFYVANLIARRVNGSESDLFSVRMVSEDGEPIRCANGYTITPDGCLDDVEPEDIVFLAPLNISGRKSLMKSVASWQPVLPWFREKGAEQRVLATCCSGAFLLAEAGLLNDKSATTAWWLTKHFEERFPEVTMEAEAVCLRADNMLLGGSSTSFQDVCLAIIEQHAGKHFARLVAKYLMLDNQRRSQAPYAILSLVESDDKVVNKAEAWIRANLAKEFKIEQVAEAVAVSPRTLIRRFQNALGETPQGFTQMLRIEKCKVLLETTQLSFAEIVQRCGYNDESAFRRLFKRHCELSPRDYRRRFNTAAQ